MGFMKKIFKALTLSTAMGFGCLTLDVYRHKVYPDQPLIAAIRHYVSVRSLSLLGGVWLRKLEAATKDVQRAQKEFLLEQLKQNADTEYSKEYKFEEINSVPDFLTRHPLTRYDHYARSVSRMLSGEKKVMTSQDPVIFAVTSGTSGHSNIIPMLNRQTKIFFLDGISVLYKCMVDTFPETKMLNRDLKVFFSPNWRYSINDIPIGPNSASPERSKDLLHLYTTPPPAYQVKSEPEALYLYMLFALKDPHLGMIEANFSSIIYNTFVAMESQIDQLTSDIASGTIRHDLDIDSHIRTQLESEMTPDPLRAEEIKAAWRKGKEGVAQRLWPELRMLLGADTGTFEMYGERLRGGYCKDIPLYSPIYAASEGLLGVNIWPSQVPSRYLLHPRTQFFEFIPEHLIDEEQPPTKLLHQVQLDQTYELVITNPTCLYRYRFGDVVKVTGFHNQCPIVEFKYRKGQFLNVRGEKTSESVFYDVLKSSIDNIWTNITLSDYCCLESTSLDSIGNLPKGLKSLQPCYHVFLELEKDDQTNVTRLTKHQRAMLDDALMIRSYPYSSFRHKGSISPLQVHLVKPGSFSELRKFMLFDSPSTSNQYKVPRVLKKTEAIQFMLQKVID